MKRNVYTKFLKYLKHFFSYLCGDKTESSVPYPAQQKRKHFHDNWRLQANKTGKQVIYLS